MHVLVQRTMLAIGLLAILSAAARASAQSVTTYHGAPDRSGRYIFPGLTFAAAAGMHLDANFAGQVSGNIYAQPLYWHGSDEDVIIVATESNNVYALDATSGKVVWQKSLPPPVGSGILP